MSMSNVARVAPVNAQTFSSVHPYTKYFPQRAEGDRLDVVPLLLAGLHGTSAKPVVVFGGEAIDRAQMAARVGAMQGWLAAQGLVPGDRVAVMLGNSAAQVALIYALMLSGLVWVPVNTRLKGDGIEYLLGHAKPTLLIAEPTFADVLDAGATLAAQQPGHHGTRVVRHWLADVMTQAAAYMGSAPAAAELTPASVLCIIYTSGTTGAPKGVLFTHRMMRIASEAALRVADAHDGDRLFLWEPLCHIGGAQMLLLPFLADLEMQHPPPCRLERVGGRFHIHGDEGGDGAAARGAGLAQGIVSGFVHWSGLLVKGASCYCPICGPSIRWRHSAALS